MIELNKTYTKSSLKKQKLLFVKSFAFQSSVSLFIHLFQAYAHFSKTPQPQKPFPLERGLRYLSANPD